MTRFYKGTNITLTTNVRDSTGTLTNATAMTFRYREGKRGSNVSVTPSNPSTGVYTASFTPLYGGPLFYEWQATTPTVSEQGHIVIERDVFAAGSSDYGG